MTRSLAPLALLALIACRAHGPVTASRLADAAAHAVQTARASAAAGDSAGAERLLADAASRSMTEPGRTLTHGSIAARDGAATVLVELAALRAARGDASGARQALDRALFESPDPAILDSLARSARFEALRALPGIGEREQYLRWARRWRGDSAFVSAYRDTLPPEERAAGVSLIWAEMRYGFVGLGRQGGDLDSAYRATLSRVLRPMDTWEYYQEIERLLSVVEDNHTDVLELPAPLRRHRAGIPMDTRRVDGAVMVVRVRSTALGALGVRVGQQVVAIDGLDPAEFQRTRTPPQLAVHTPQAREAVAFGWKLWLGEAGSVVTVRLRDPRGAEQDVPIRRGGWSDATSDPPVLARSLGDGVGYLAINTFGDPKVATMIDSGLASLGRLRGLIVDTRLNSGGSQDAGWHLLSQWLRAPFVQREQYTNAYVGIWRAWGGATVRMPLPERVIRPHPTIHRDIPLLWLTGPRTASAAEGVAALVEQTGVGTTMGEPTFGSTGQPILVPLPGGGRARIRVEEERFNDGRTYTRLGIAPMIPVRVTVAGIAAERDEVLEAAIAEMRRRLTPP